MPRHLIALPDIEQTVTRPLTFQIVNQIYEIAQLPTDTEIQYAGKRGTNMAPGTSMSDFNRSPKFTTSNITFITITEDYDQSSVQEIQPYSWDQKPVFLDDKLHVSLRPVYIPVNAEIEIVFRHTSETEIRKWLGMMISRVSHGRDINLHDITYSYPLSHEFTLLLEDIHALREAVDGYNESFSTYFDKCRSARMTTFSNIAGEQRHLVVKETQSQIIGTFEFPVLPEKPEHLQDIGLWQGRLVYKFMYQRPDQVLVDFPISVHNQYLPEKYLKNLETVIDPRQARHYQSYSYAALDHFSCDHYAEQSREPYPYIQIPSFDDFGKTSHGSETIFPQKTATILTALCFLDEDKKTLANLNELGDVYIDEDILAFLKSEYRYLNKPYLSIFQVTHYQDGIMRPYDKIEILSDLTVRAVNPLSLRQRHHIRLSLYPDIHQPLYGALKRLAGHPKAFYKVIRSMNELLAIDPDFNNWEKTEKIDDWMFEAVYRILNVTHQGNLMSPNTNLDAYLTDWAGTTRNNFHLLTKLDPKVIQQYLEQKRRLRHTVMNAYIIARPANLLELN